MTDFARLLKQPDDLLETAGRYSLDPTSYATGTEYAATRVIEEDGDFKDFTHNLVKDDQRIVYATLEQKTDHALSGADCGAASSLKLKAQVATRDDWHPIWFLPWNEKGAAVEMTIPKVSRSDAAKQPAVFFTAALSGCSVLFKGTTSNPTIIHGGSAQTVVPYDANRFWKDFVKYLNQNPDEKTTASRTGRIRAQAVKNQYVVGESVVTPDGRSAKTTKHALEFKDKLTDHYGDKVQVLEVIPWGSVFGVRKGTDWRFFLQENANIIYYPTRKIQQVFAHDKLDDTPTTVTRVVRSMGAPNIVSRPMALQEVFPTGSKTAKIQGRWRSLLRRDQLSEIPSGWQMV